MRGSASSRVSPGTPMRRIEAGTRAISSGVRLRFSGWIAGSPLGSRAERVEAGGEVAVGAVALEQRGRRLHRLQQLLVGLGGGDGGVGVGEAVPSGGAEAEAGCAEEIGAASRPRSAATPS